MKTQVSSRCSSIVKFKEEMGTSIRLYGGSNSSMQAHVSIEAANFGDSRCFIMVLGLMFFENNYRFTLSSI